MSWRKCSYTKKQIVDAGKKISYPGLSDEERKEYLHIIDEWRAAHAFPMNTFAINLKHQVQDIKGAIVVQRLKRLKTILHKLERFPNMSLYRMQDLGGCRVILPSIESVYEIKKKLKESRIRHILHNEKDYIAVPKPDTGYRGIHIIYRYRSEKRTDFNGLQIEIQIRTKLQHLWATAVETIGVFTKNGLKFNQGSERWLRFFKLVSALFAIEEKTAIVEGVPSDPIQIGLELMELMEELSVVDRLRTIKLASKQLGRYAKSKTPGYFLLILDLQNSDLRVEKFASIEPAAELYDKLEEENTKNEKDIVLVEAESFDTLIHAYPNYFADVFDFTNIFLDLCRKHFQSFKLPNN